MRLFAKLLTGKRWTAKLLTASSSQPVLRAPAFCLGALALTSWLLPANVGQAAPTLSITNTGANLSGNLEWLVEITPDTTLFASTDLGLGSSLAVELSFEISGSDLVSAAVNNTDWPHLVPGNNPFTGTPSSGVTLNLVNGTLFASLLSNFFVAETAVEVLTIETSGTDCTSIVLGGHDLLAGTADEYVGSLIAQAGQNFTGYQFAATQPRGDFDLDCDVDGSDFLTWQRNYGAPYTAADLADWESNYSTVAPLVAISTTVPEPTTFCLLLLGLQTLCFLKRSKA